VVFAGAASQPATTEVAQAFEKETGIKVDCTFGGSGSLLTQIKMEHFGDVYIPGSNDYMDKAEKEKVVDPTTRKIVCYLVPAICVAKGNPRQIQGLKDLARPGLKVTIGDPESVCLGAIAKATLEKAGLYEQVGKNVVTYASDCQQVASLIRLNEVDAAIGYDVFQVQTPKDLDLVKIPGVEMVNIPAAVVTYSKEKDLAQQFVEYIAGPKGLEIFTKQGYTVKKGEGARSGP
jgi:molybdate transport system substrate-binding protein